MAPAASQTTPEAPPSANACALATWLVPGAGHFMLGDRRTALIGFLLIQGLYLAGVMLSDGMFLQVLPPEMRGRFAGALTPEAGNLGALLLQGRQVGFGSGIPLPFPDGLHVGMMLTSAAGILNLLLAARAHFDARARSGAVIDGAARHPGTCALLGWLVPGLGHLAQGRVARGLVAFVLVVGLFALGTMLAEGTNLDRTRHFYYWAGQAFLGPIAFGAEIANGHSMMTERPEYADAGVMLASIAGMLNVMLLLDVYGFSDAKLFGRPLFTEGSRAAAGEVAR
ncbi:MAG: DUF6677 family protein [Planctomycetota bacterium]|nr:DUF6677 family protein [Planctomycetota bacterium]